MVQGSGAFLGFGEQGGGVVAYQELDGGGIGVVLGNAVHRKAERNGGDVQDVPLLGVLLALKDDALQHLHRRLESARESKRSLSKLVLGEELSDCSLGRKLPDAREHLVPPAEAEQAQRQVVLGVRRNKSFQSAGGASKLDEAREHELLELCVAVEQQAVDLVVVAAIVVANAHSRDEPRRMATDQQLNDTRIIAAS